MREKDYSTQHFIGVFRNKNETGGAELSFSLGCKNPKQKKSRTKEAQREKAQKKTKKKRTKQQQNGEHTIRPVALVGGVGVRPRRV